VKEMKLQEVKKVLFSGKGKIIISIHTMQRLEQRGYTKADIVTAILNGEIVERQSISKVAVLGRDTDDNPVVVCHQLIVVDLNIVFNKTKEEENYEFLI